MENKIADEITITIGRLGKPYFFIKDPDGILVEIIEKDLPKTKLDNEAKQNIKKIIRNVNDTGFYSKNKFHQWNIFQKLLCFLFY